MIIGGKTEKNNNGANASGYGKWIAILSVVAVIGTFIIMSITYYNSFNGKEIYIKAVDKDMQNVHASFHKQMRAQGISVEKYGDLVIKALQVSMGGRYGANGSQAAMQWIKEQNPTIDPKMFSKLQQVIEAGYNKFESVQRKKIDMVAVYEKQATNFPGVVFAGIFNFPKKPFDELGRIITSAETKIDFEKGELSDPKIFSDK